MCLGGLEQHGRVNCCEGNVNAEAWFTSGGEGVLINLLLRCSSFVAAVGVLQECKKMGSGHFIFYFL